MVVDDDNFFSFLGQTLIKDGYMNNELIYKSQKAIRVWTNWEKEKSMVEKTRIYIMVRNNESNKQVFFFLS